MTVLFTSLIVLSGCDKLTLSTGVGNIRLSFLVYALVAAWGLFAIRWPVLPTLLILSAAAGAIPSLLETSSLGRSLAYLGWMLFSYFVIFGLFRTLTLSRPRQMHQAVLWAFRLQAIVCILQFAARPDADRPSLFYYEPSYFAYALLLYAAIPALDLTRQRVRWVDWLLLGLVLVATKSAMLLVGLACLFTLCLLFFCGARGYVAAAAFSSIIVLAVCGYITVSSDLLADTIRNMLQADNPLEYLLARGGNRYPRMLCAWDTFISHPLAGIGVGDFHTYVNTLNERPYTHGIPWISIRNQPAVNIVFELLATTGIFGTVPVLLFFAYCLTRRRPIRMAHEERVYALALGAMLVMLLFEANYLRPYLWMLLGIYSGTLAANDLAARTGSPAVPSSSAYGAGMPRIHSAQTGA